MLDKAIESGKEHRKQYRRSKRFDRTCRNHGSCPYCESNRLFNRRRGEFDQTEKVKNFEKELDIHTEI